VSQGRQGRLKGPTSEIFNGRIFTAEQALASGLVDALGYSEDACDWAAQKAALSNPRIVRYQRRLSGLEMLLSRGGIAPAADGARGLSIHIDRNLLDELSAPRLLYLWRGD
jgi:protease IV